MRKFLKGMFKGDIVEKMEQIETPFYYYDLDLLHRTLTSLKSESSKYGFKVHYAVKANHNDRIMSIIREYGFGVDCVSWNEVAHALNNGFQASDVVFAGVGKTDRELRNAIKGRIGCINVESVTELGVIATLCRETGIKTVIALRINPNVDANTHKYITTGIEESKFGIMIRDLESALSVINDNSQLDLAGIHFHIGSQIQDMSVFKSLCVKANEILAWLESRGYQIRDINVGGGLGIDYNDPDSLPDFDQYFKVFAEHLNVRPGQTLRFEIGRAAVGNAGSLISRVLYVKEGITSKFAVIDAGMNDLIRPALYQAYHKIENLTSNQITEKYTVVGPICESSDMFGSYRELPGTERGDLVAIRSAGAYGEAMASEYNMRTLPQSLFSDEI